MPKISAKTGFAGESAVPITLKLNGQPRAWSGDPDQPLLWFIRDDAGLVGTKFGCGIGSCGACTVHVDGAAQRSCVTPMAAVDGKSVTTIEGIGKDGALHPVQQAWLDEDVAQCGYCQPGQIMAAIDFLQQNPSPDEAAIRASINNLCRCGTYVRIARAIQRAARSGAKA
nr:(2Fe-2S)-binding protein [Novosphingobium flavum]